MEDKEPLTCSVEDFSRIVGIGINQAQAVCAGEFPPPMIWSGERRRIIRSEIPAWLLRYGEWQRRRLGAEALEGTAAEPERRRLTAL
ncbi:MAG: hypothetical protein PHS28_05430 [Atopobiaceae bacterium]|jgi:hypothetical protein|nr:hypothetical protein [Atopobiaceae bacterium]